MTTEEVEPNGKPIEVEHDILKEAEALRQIEDLKVKPGRKF